MMIGNTTGEGLLTHFYHILKKYNMLNIETKPQKFPNLKDRLAKRSNSTGIIK